MIKKVREGEYYYHSLKTGVEKEIYVPPKASEKHTKYNSDTGDIEISKHRLTTLAEPQIDVLYFHEEGHKRLATSLSNKWWSIFIISTFSIIIPISYLIGIWILPLLIVIILIHLLLRELYCDRYSVKRTNLDLFIQTIHNIQTIDVLWLIRIKVATLWERGGTLKKN
jgi:hypothetical protein